ncbi:cyclin-dependent kinase [Metarhizium robertsii ARSEF 23]|uniref:Cyclin-dependent kinase n=1 Tax=Metarhizium robertsii (strain ARSEF 23 / ATCC MYA-3075) TaxID=655844 RepID=E9EZU0_METRA|nr:cyclin-dependent kinase [Metarhizium robertsii ARSEF 23]EFY99481.1 cyclin-dependent kinase [Metarhizium robertsii ARSEF 23]
MDIDPYPASQSVHGQDQLAPSGHDSGTNSSQSQTQSITDSQTSNASSATDQVATPPGSDSGSGVERPPVAEVTAMLKNRYANVGPEVTTGVSSQDSQLHQLSAIAAVQDRLGLDAAGLPRKRMADGEVKDRKGSMSPVKGHSRTTSTVSVASTAGSTIGEVCMSPKGKLSCCLSADADLVQLSAELRTRLSYAMVKVNNGWQARNLDEVESLASQATSPASSTSTVHGRKGSSASPRLPSTVTPSHPQFTYESMNYKGKSNSPPSANSDKPTLAPPASIQPSSSMPAPRSNPRRNSNPRYTPTMLSHSHSASANASAQTTPISNGIRRSHSHLDANMYSPHHKNVREQDAIETLLFMSSPGNSASLKHTFSPSGSPGPQSSAPPRSVGERHALPSGPRRGLPGSRPPSSAKKVGFDKSPGVPPPHSPMDLDSPQQQHYAAHNRSTPKRQATSLASRHRTTLSLPSGLGLGNGTARKTLRDEDIERMLDHAGAELADSSDDEEIQLPPGRNRLAGAMGI